MCVKGWGEDGELFVVVVVRPPPGNSIRRCNIEVTSRRGSHYFRTFSSCSVSCNIDNGLIMNARAKVK